MRLSLKVFSRRSRPDPALPPQARRAGLTALCAWLLAAIALVGLAAEFFAPYPPDSSSQEYLHAPPQPLRFNLRDGLHVRPLIPRMHPVTRRWQYAVDGSRVVPVHVFPRGDAYRLGGLLPFDRRFIGVRHDAEARQTFFLLGTDAYGRDVFSRLVHGVRISLGLAVLAVAVMTFIGVAVGSLSGYYGGRLDAVIQRSMEIVNAVPHFPLFLGLSAALPNDWSITRTYFAIVGILTLLGWTGIARVVRGKVLALREEEYVVAARLSGAGLLRILFRHILPSFTGHLAVSAMLAVPATIIGETSLSFLGLGLRDPVPSWGVMIQDCISFDAMENYPWLFAPVVAILATVFLFNFLGEGLRQSLDPHSATHP